MINADEIREGFELLRELCDPRGHALLDTLESLLLTESRLLDETIEMTRKLDSKADVVPMIDRYSRRA